MPSFEQTYKSKPFNLSDVQFFKGFFGQREDWLEEYGIRKDYDIMEAQFYILSFNKILIDKYGSKKATVKANKAEKLIQALLNSSKHLKPYKVQIRTFIISSLAYMYFAEYYWKEKSFNRKAEIKRRNIDAEKTAKNVWQDLFKIVNQNKSYIKRLDLLRRYIKGSENKLIPLIEHLKHEAHHLKHVDPLVSTDPNDTHLIFRKKERFLIHALKNNTKLTEYKIIQFVEKLEAAFDLPYNENVNAHQRIRTRYNLTKKKLGISTP